MVTRERSLFEVSVKAAILSQDNSAVLVMAYSHGKFGLPGGHLEPRETLTEAVMREMNEEIGVLPDDLLPTGFFLADSGKVILGYRATLDKMISLAAEDPRNETPQWVTRDEFMTLDMSESYRTFVMAHWPKY